MLVGVIALRMNDDMIVRSSMILTVIGSVLLASSSASLSSLIGLMLVGLGLAAQFPILIAQTPGRVGKQHAPNTIGFLVGFAGLGGAILPGITSVIAERTSLEVIAYMLAINSVAVIVVYTWLVRRVEKRTIVTAGT